MAATIQTSITTALRQPSSLPCSVGSCTVTLRRALGHTSKRAVNCGVRSFSLYGPADDVHRELEEVHQNQEHLSERETFALMLELDTEGGFGSLRRVKQSIREEKSEIHKRQAQLLERESYLIGKLKEAHGGNIRSIMSQLPKSCFGPTKPQGDPDKTVQAKVRIAENTIVPEPAPAGSPAKKQVSNGTDLNCHAGRSMAHDQELNTAGPTLISLRQDLAVIEGQILSMDQRVKDISSLDSIPGSDEQSAAQKEQYKIVYEEKTKLLQKKWSIQEQIAIMENSTKNVMNGNPQNSDTAQGNAKEEATLSDDIITMIVIMLMLGITVGNAMLMLIGDLLKSLIHTLVSGIETIRRWCGWR